MADSSIQQEPCALAPAAVERFLARRQELFRKHDAAALADDYAPDCVVESPVRGTIHGREDVEALFRDFFRAFPDVEYQRQEVLVDRDRLALTCTMRGTHHGEFLGLAGTGRSFDFQVAQIFKFRGDQIIEERRIYDFTGLLLQIGVLKVKPAF